MKTDAEIIAAADAVKDDELLDAIYYTTVFRDRLLERYHKGNDKPGTWPRHCEQRAFCEGVAWWQFENEETWSDIDRDASATEAIRRYGVPREDVPRGDADDGAGTKPAAGTQ